MALCQGVHTVQRQTPTQIAIAFCTNSSFDLDFGVGQCESTVSMARIDCFKYITSSLLTNHCLHLTDTLLYSSESDAYKRWNSFWHDYWQKQFIGLSGVLIHIAGSRFQFLFRLKKWLHNTIFTLHGADSDSDSNPNCQLQQWDREWNRNPGMWM